jgi:hypothetical protein
MKDSQGYEAPQVRDLEELGLGGRFPLGDNTCTPTGSAGNNNCQPNGSGLGTNNPCPNGILP